MPHILVAGPIHEAGMQLLRDAPGVSVTAFDDVTFDARLSELAAADAVVLRTQPLTAALTAQAPRLRIVSRHGVGYDSVDVRALEARRIPLAVCGDVNSISVAEHAMMLLLAVAKRTLAMHVGTQAGRWPVRLGFDGFELHGRTLLVIGFGRIGRRMAALASAFGMRVLAHDPYLGSVQIEAAGAQPVADLGSAWPQADVVSLHLPKSGTQPLIGAAELARMKRGAIIVNTARGGLIDETALTAALADGHLGGAGLDVFASEPPPADAALLASGRVVLSPHVAGLSAEAAMRMSVGSVRNVLDFFAGRIDPALVVNRAALSDADLDGSRGGNG